MPGEPKERPGKQVLNEDQSAQFQVHTGAKCNKCVLSFCECVGFLGTDICVGFLGTYPVRLCGRIGLLARSNLFFSFNALMTEA